MTTLATFYDNLAQMAPNLTFIEMIQKKCLDEIKSSPEYLEFANLADKDKNKEVISNYVKNTLFKSLDVILKPILDNPDLNKVFTSPEYTKYSEDLAKVYITKVIKYLIQQVETIVKTYYKEYEYLLLILFDKKYKLSLVQDILEIAEGLVDFKTIKSGKDLYNSLVDVTTKLLLDTYSQLIKAIDRDNVKALKDIVNTVNYKTAYNREKIKENKRPREEDDKESSSSTPKKPKIK